MPKVVNINTASLNARDNLNMRRNMPEANSECLHPVFALIMSEYVG